MEPIKLYPALNRFCKIYGKDAPEVPAALFSAEPCPPDLPRLTSRLTVPLPSRARDYVCCAEGEDGVIWLGASTGLTRCCPNASRSYDAVMYFSADRDLPDNSVKALLADGAGVWALTETGVAHIDMRPLSCEEKADMLLDETLRVVWRRGMVSQKGLAVPRDLSSAYPHACSDNDGCFTAGFAIGEMFHYATLRRERGESDERTREIREIATRSCEACLLLMNISGRGDGFVARTYLTPDEPVPDDGIFFRKQGDSAVCIDTESARKRKMAGLSAPVTAPVPDRLAALYRSKGCSDDGIVYKGDTSSDEITLHFLQMYFAHIFLAPEDPELDELIKSSARATMKHIIDHGFELHDFTGKPTTWAKWSPAYFNSGLGWVDAALNAAEVLMYLRVTMAVTGERGCWREAYDRLIADGYAELTLKHRDRFVHGAMLAEREPIEDLMFGDNMLAVAAFWGLAELEDDPALKELYRRAFKGWESVVREKTPGYDFPYLASCPDAELDREYVETWFRRTNVSRLASSVSLNLRNDVPMKIRRGGYRETSWLLPPDERFIAKYDRNPFEYKNEDSGGTTCVESCYVYTFAYWIGRYYGFIY